MLIYRRVFDYITSSWVILPFDTDPKKEAESIYLSDEQLKLTGLYKGYKPKSYSELTEEEKKLFIDD